MFDVGWSELLVIAVVMIVVVGPKDLPNMLRTFGRTTAKLRAMAADFQRQFNDALKEAELDDIKKSVDELRGLNPANEIRKQLNPFEQAAADVRSGVDNMMKPKPAADPAAPAASAPQAAEPLKNGATVMPGADEPATASPIFPAMTDESVVAMASPVEKPPAPQEAPPAKQAVKAMRVKAAPATEASAKASPATARASASAKSAAATAPAAAKVPAKAIAAKPTAAKAAKAAAAKPVAAKAPATGAESISAAAKMPAARKKTAGAAK